jgi:hypothetical protein
MSRGVKIPWMVGSIYHMDRGVNITWIGDSIYYGEGIQNTMDRGVDIP